MTFNAQSCSSRWAATLVFLACVPTLSASLITYQLTNVFTTENYPVTGSFVYDTLTRTVPTASIYSEADSELTRPPEAFAQLFFYDDHPDFPVTNSFQLCATPRPFEDLCEYQGGSVHYGLFYFLDDLGAPTLRLDSTISQQALSTPDYSYFTFMGGSATATPEPSTAVIVLLGAVGLLGGTRFRKSRQAKQPKTAIPQHH